MFNSVITLKFKDRYYETQYKEDKYLFRKKYNIILSIILLCFSISISIGMLIEYPYLKEQFSLNYSTIFCFITGLLNIILVFLCIFIKSNKVQEWLTYVNYMMILPIFTIMRYFITWAVNLDMYVYVFIFFVELILRLIWFVLGLIDFVPGIYLQVLTIVANFGFFSVLITLPFYYRFSIYTFILIFISVLSYFFILEQKRSFYYNFSLKLKNEWYESIIDNMNSGFISIKDKEVQYYNKTLLSFFKGTCGSNDYLGLNREVSCLVKIDINELFKNIIFEDNKINTFEQVACILSKKYKLVGHNFVFLGTKDIEVTPSNFINLEVFGRCYSSNHNVLDRYEFIFNDITRSKQIEQKNAEFKYKTLFLSKIAHEFKNPLLCISELVDQVNDNLRAPKTNKTDINNNSDILKQIKSISNYLIILVKDMDYFSQKNSETIIEKKVEVDKIPLIDIVKFCNDIVLALIKKSHKEMSVGFQVIRENHLPSFITTDEIKLKQILINLLSNAVKYTYHGSIYLRVMLKDNSLKFQIDDTGKGISDDQKEKLFTPFSNESDKLNRISSGLGLFIVKELLGLLGSRIEFESTASKGSSFWFILPLNDNDLNISFISESTMLGTHFNEQPIKFRLDSADAIGSTHNVIVVDDESVIRQATIRLLYKAFNYKKLNINILEASDGIECLNICYNYIKDGKTISFVISDETMVYMNGSNTAKILDGIYKQKNMLHVPFYILTAYENISLGSAKETIDGVFTKPLRKQYIDEIFKTLNSDV
jgi:signal transduction histidine kinase